MRKSTKDSGRGAAQTSLGGNCPWRSACLAVPTVRNRENARRVIDQALLADPLMQRFPDDQACAKAIMALACLTGKNDAIAKLARDFPSSETFVAGPELYNLFVIANATWYFKDLRHWVGRTVSAWHLARLGEYERWCHHEKVVEKGSDILLGIPQAVVSIGENPCPKALTVCSLSELSKLAKSVPGILNPDENGQNLAHALASVESGDLWGTALSFLDQPRLSRLFDSNPSPFDMMAAASIPFGYPGLHERIAKARSSFESKALRKKLKTFGKGPAASV